MKYQELKSGKKIQFDIAIRKIKYLGINLTKEVKDLLAEKKVTQQYLCSFLLRKLPNTEQRNQRRHKQMETYTVFMDWKN